MKDEKYLEKNHIEIPIESVPSIEGYKKLMSELGPSKPEMPYHTVCHDFVVIGIDGDDEIIECKDCRWRTTRKITNIQDNEESKGMKR